MTPKPKPYEPRGVAATLLAMNGAGLALAIVAAMAIAGIVTLLMLAAPALFQPAMVREHALGWFLILLGGPVAGYLLGTAAYAVARERRARS